MAIALLIALLITFPCSAELPIALKVNTQNRQEVEAFYRSVYKASMLVPSEYTGDHERCFAGTTSKAYEEATLLRINYFRAMAGVSADVTLDSDLNAKCQEAALIMAANRALSHAPLEDWHCFTADGALAARRSNLALGVSGPEAIDLFMSDPGADNKPVGHRRWILFPPQKVMGVGSVVTPVPSNALWVLSGWNAPPPGPAFVAWPPAGYVPEAVFPRSGRWSLTIPGASFTNARVSMSVAGRNMSLQIEDARQVIGDPSIVWHVGFQSFDIPRKPTFLVRVSNILIGGVRQDISYEVTRIPVDPLLLVEPGRDGELVFSWDAADGYVQLQQSADPYGEQGWALVPPPYERVGRKVICKLRPSGNAAYFRLWQINVPPI